ncbi:hypothetical protein GPECTOR_2g1238 [Gonium pectorale]|uniref:Uncharacterized protein n=1 Tax=Gonium pectorale TaxID=33097 RepID=A0A150H1E6_GONPE|nr:hypothetical protein GPECTOR_2g1238 [Gonium pectorale]|eukprot:KXZ55688.1 hypothetical protein GPECTOR_2g1238 [Gonium pectorale]
MPSISPSPGNGLLSNLRELVINASFYRSTTDGGGGTDPLSGSEAAEAWESLGRLLATRCPQLERLDLAYTHAITYVDPARGATTAPWPPLLQLRELVLAHDLAVQPPPLLARHTSAPQPTASSPVSASVASTPPGAGEGSTSGSAAAVGAQSHAAAGSSGGTPKAACSTAAAGRATGAVNSQVPEQAFAAAPLQELSAGGGGAASGSAAVASAATQGGPGLGSFCFSELNEEEKEVEEEEEAEEEAGEVAFGPPSLTVDAAHASVELLTWLPSCSAVTSLDLRRCGLEAVPLAVTHLPALARLDLQGNPLASMRLPGPLPCLTRLRFSLDPCYDLLYDMTVAINGEVAAAEEFWTVELPAPLLEELEVDSSSERALGLLREAASGLSHVRQLTLVSTDALA